MRPAPGLNKAQQEAYLASVKAFQDRRGPKGPTPSGGGLFDQIGSFMKNNPNKGGGGSMGPRNPNQPTPKPPRPGMSDPRVTPPRPPVTPGKPSPMGNIAAMAGKGLNAMGMKKGGMATKKKAGKISEYGGKEMYSSKKGMMKHEGMESMKMEKSEGMKMRGGGMTARKGYADGGMPMVMKEGKKVPSFAADGKGKMKHGGMAHDAKAKKGRGMAIMIAIGKPKGRGKS